MKRAPVEREIAGRLREVSGENLRREIFYLCRDPLPFRRVNFTRPWQPVDSLAETDAHIRRLLENDGYAVRETRHRIRPLRCNPSKPLHHWYDRPQEDDPWYDAANLEATRPGREIPGEITQLVAHKDSMSWIDSPGAHDNACGTAANLEIARLLARLETRRTVRFLFCNEEHSPWTSRFAAEEAFTRGDDILAVLNQDLLDGKSQAEMDAGALTHCAGYSTEEGRPLAEFIAACAPLYTPRLSARAFFKPKVNDDDGMFIRAGYPVSVMNTGAWPIADPEYHLPGDTPERVNIDNLALSTQLLLAAVLEIDAGGRAAFGG